MTARELGRVLLLLAFLSLGCDATSEVAPSVALRADEMPSVVPSTVPLSSFSSSPSVVETIKPPNKGPTACQRSEDAGLFGRRFGSKDQC